MVQVDLPAAFAVGQIFAFLSRDYLKKEPRKLSSRLLGPLNIYLSCMYVPVGMFLLIGWPAWEVMYQTGWVERPFDRPWVAGFYILFLIAMVVIGNAGFLLAHHWYRHGHDRWVIWGSVAGLALTALPFVLRWGVWLRVGTYEEVTAGGGYSFWDPPFFHGWLAIILYLVVTTVLAGWWFWKKGSRIEP